MYTMRSPPVTPLWGTPNPQQTVDDYQFSTPYTASPTSASYGRPEYMPGVQGWSVGEGIYSESPMAFQAIPSTDVAYSVTTTPIFYTAPAIGSYGGIQQELPPVYYSTFQASALPLSPTIATTPKRRKASFHSPYPPYNPQFHPSHSGIGLPFDIPSYASVHKTSSFASSTGAVAGSSPKSIDSTYSCSPVAGVKRDSSSSGDDSCEIKRKPKRARNLGNEQMKLETSLTRITGACVACQRKKIRCKPADDPDAPCLNCAGALLRRRAESTVHMMPCVRAKITATLLFRNGPTEEFLWTRRWINTTVQEITSWAKPERYAIRITQDRAPPLEVTVKEYIPTEGDWQCYAWQGKDGSVKKLDLGPFAIADIDATKRAFESYVDNNMEEYIENCLEGSRPIVQVTFAKALNMSAFGGSPLIHDALRLFVAARFIEDQWRICGGDDSLNLQPDLETGSPYFNRIPVTPVIDYQLDSIVINLILKPLKARILQTLQEKILKTKPDMDWLEIKITTFILLTSLEWSIRHDNRFARRYALPTRFSNQKLIEEAFQSGKNLLWHFRAVAGGAVPFFLDWKETDGQDVPGQNSAEASRNSQIAYIKEMKRLSEQERDRLINLKAQNRYEEEMYWTGQMFVEDWKPGDTPPPGLEAEPLSPKLSTTTNAKPGDGTTAIKTERESPVEFGVGELGTEIELKVL